MSKDRAVSIASAVGIALIVAALLPNRSSTTWVDPVTGSVKRQESWQIYKRPPVVESSEIERWIVQTEGSYTPTWRFVSQTRRTIFGHPLSVGCSDVPMYPLRAGDRNSRFVRSSAEEQVAEFVRIMRTGSDFEKREAIRAAYRANFDE